MTRGIVSCIVCTCLLLSASAVSAWSEEINTEPPEAKEQKLTEDTSSTGIEVGSFSLLPELSITGVYDDNIFATRDQTKSDRIVRLRPSVKLRSNGSANSLKLNLGADIAKFDKYSSEDYEDYWLSTDGRYEISEALKLFGGFSYNREHEERGSPDDQNGTEPTIYYSRSAHLGSEVTAGAFGFRFGGTYEELDFDDVNTSTGPDINNDDRDRELLGAGLRVSYAWSEQIQPFVQYVYDERNYDSHLDDNRYRRDSDGYEFAAGFKLDMKPTLLAEFHAGALRQNYADNRFAPVSKIDFGANLTWAPRQATRVTGVIERSVKETTLSGNSGYLETLYALNVDHRLTRSTSFHSHLQLSLNDYQGTQREDQHIEAGFGLRYDLTKNLFIDADYSFSNRNSNIASGTSPDDYDYYRHQFLVSLGTRLYPVKDDPLRGFSEALADLYATNEPSNGFYLGTLASYAALATKSTEQRLHGGSSKADFGGDGFSGGIFGGYSSNHNRWIFGLELEAEDSSLEWTHSKAKPGSRTFSVKQNEGVGASTRLGYTMLDGSVLYGRIGFIRTRFDTFYQINPEIGQPAVDIYSNTETLTGLRIGVGLDVPLSPQWFWRMESTYTDYESYDVASTGFNEKFEPEEHFFSFGLGWHFDAADKPPEDPLGKDLNGPYAGVQIGFGTLSSEVDGMHNDGGGGPYAYQSDFAGQGLNSGLFVGYGNLFDRIYLAGELEAEVNAAEWFRNRETSGGGRNFSVEAKEGYGAAARLGYHCRNGTLAYLKAGVVSTKLITRHAKGSNRGNVIYRDKSIDGIRLGLGIETPMTQSAFMRLEYVHTEYDDFGLVTAHGNSDQLNFAYHQDMIRLGIVFRF